MQQESNQLNIAKESNREPQKKQMWLISTVSNSANAKER